MHAPTQTELSEDLEQKGRTMMAVHNPATMSEVSTPIVFPHPDDEAPIITGGRIHPDDLDRQVIRFMVKKFGMGEKQISLALCARTSSTISDTYDLIVSRKLQGLGYPEYPMDELRDKWGVTKNIQDKRVAIERIRNGLSEIGGHGEAVKSATTRSVLHFPTSIVPPPAELSPETPSPGKYYCRTPILEKIPIGPVEKVRPITPECTETTIPDPSRPEIRAEPTGHHNKYRTLRLDLRDMSPPLCRQQSSSYSSMLSRAPKLRSNADEIYRDYLQKLRQKKLTPGRGILKNDVICRPPLMIEKPGRHSSLVQMTPGGLSTVPRGYARPVERARSQSSTGLSTMPSVGGVTLFTHVDTPARGLDTPLPDVECSQCHVVARLPSAAVEQPSHVSRATTKSAKSVRFRDDTPCEENHSVLEPIAMYAVRRLSAHHARSQRDMLFVARLQAEKRSLLKQFDCTMDPKAQYRRWLQHLNDDGHGEVTETCPAPPNSVQGFHSPSGKQHSAHCNTSAISEPLPVLTKVQSRHSKEKAPHDANINEDVFCDTYRKKHGGQRSDRVVVWDIDMLELDLSGERITQKPKGEYFVRRLGTIPNPCPAPRGSISADGFMPRKATFITSADQISSPSPVQASAYEKPRGWRHRLKASETNSRENTRDMLWGNPPANRRNKSKSMKKEKYQDNNLRDCKVKLRLQIQVPTA